MVTASEVEIMMALISPFELSSPNETHLPSRFLCGNLLLR